MLVYKLDVLKALKGAGYSSDRLRKEKLLGQAAIQDMRNGKPVGIKSLDTICRLLDMQPGNIYKYEPDKKEA